ncbi:hypothetical protein BVRB_4g084890 [Beta vulgaris subsp. vulgaris]|nr:hypothetical protein BVRB_4g084890 [Beta vulgaris subsp. vulgaris]
MGGADEEYRETKAYKRLLEESCSLPSDEPIKEENKHHQWSNPSGGEAITLLLAVKLRTVDDGEAPFNCLTTLTVKLRMVDEGEAWATNKDSSESQPTNKDSSEIQPTNEESIDGVFVFGEGWPVNQRSFRVCKPEEEG